MTIFHWCLDLFFILQSLLINPLLAFQNIDPSKCKVYGPGIENPQFHMPVRYFFVDLVGSDEQKLNKSAGEAFLLVENLNQTSCSIWSKVLDRHDGSYIIRYKLLKECSSLKLAITTPEGRHLADSPYTLKGPLYPDTCYCPDQPDHWSKSMECLNNYEQLTEDLSSWKNQSIDFKKVVEDAASRWGSHPGAFSYCHYVIVDNQVSRKCYGQHIGFNMFSDAILLSLTRKVHLPNTQFLMNLGDWPLEKRSSGFLIPMFSWCGSEDTKDIVVPTYEMTESTLEMMGRQFLDIFSAETFAKVPWEEKESKGYWRGRDSNEERLQLVNISRHHPDLLDAAITRFFFFRDRMDEFGPETPTVNFEHFFKYKYQVTLDGTVAAYRLAYLLAGNGLVLKQDSKYYEHYYRRLIPWKHYVPVRRDLSDLIEKIEWAMENDAEASKISRRGRSFVRKFLNPKEIFCYYAKAIQDYTNLLADPPSKLPTEGFEKVEQPKEAFACQCESLISMFDQKYQGDIDVQGEDQNKVLRENTVAKDEL